MTPSLGTIAIDLKRMLDSHALIQSSTGYGKSWALRRIIEQTAGQVQQLVIDPEGEFSTLREKFDFIVCAPSGADAVATPATAAALALALWKAGTSAILDIYELKAHERQEFVSRFLNALIEAPRCLWHQTMVVVDEIHVFAPQVGSTVASQAVVDVASRGRKRGLCMLGATQRLSKLDKDVAAELQTKMIGRTALDIDITRACDALGLNKSHAAASLMALEPGQFFVCGPAFGSGVKLQRVGPVTTHHPTTGQRAIAPPPPSRAILAQLAKLEGIQREVVQEVSTLAEARAETARLRKQLALRAVPSEGELAARSLQDKLAMVRLLAPHVEALFASVSRVQRIIDTPTTPPVHASPSAAPTIEAGTQTVAAARQAIAAPAGAALRSGAKRILLELAARAPAGYTRSQVGLLTKFAPKGGTFCTYLSDLRQAGFITEKGALLYASENGIAACGREIKAPTTHGEAMALWKTALRSGAFELLAVIVASGSTGMTREHIARSVGMAPKGGTFGTYLSNLRTNGLIFEVEDGLFLASELLYPRRPT